MIQFPFAAIVGMEDARKSLVYHAIDPRIGGTLFLGHRGCAKSTLVRAFAEVLQLACDQPAPFVEVPLGTTEDRLLGSVDAQSLVQKQLWSSRSGLIEEAHGGVLYVDEINLLPDHLADLILDSASSNQYRMERDGITRFVESRYILVGTMNPEEGDLRPQLSDRFAHGVPIQDDFGPEERMEIVRRRIEFDDRPETFVERYREATSTLVSEIRAARQILPLVNISDERRLAVAAKGKEFKLEGLRPELAVVRTARCAAAWANRMAVEECDLDIAWRLCLGHRHITKARNSRSETPPTSPADRPPPFDGRSITTSRAPLESRPDGKELFELVPHSHNGLSNWLVEKSKIRSSLLGRLGGRISENKAIGPIGWIQTLVASVRAGWLENSDRIRLCRRTLPTKKHIWCFLDASRSTGMNQFLARARDLLAGMASFTKSGKFHLLLLNRGEVRWQCRSATSKTFVSELGLLRTAGGKSLIVEAITALHRRSLAKSNSANNRVLILSDGLASPRSGEHPSDTMLRLRSTVQRLASNGAVVAWLSPNPKRGLKRWLPQLLRGISIAHFEI
jgi:magnesium chelatase subunit I